MGEGKKITNYSWASDKRWQKDMEKFGGRMMLEKTKFTKKTKVGFPGVYGVYVFDFEPYTLRQNCSLAPRANDAGV